MSIGMLSAKAREIMTNEVYVMAINETKQRIYDAWLACEDPAERERLWLRSRNLFDLTKTLRSIRDRGLSDRHTKEPS